jgi:predicted porin
LTWGAGKLSVAGGYKRVDPFFGAPGAWGNIGRWKNPTNIKGWDASAGYNFGGFTLKGSWEDYKSVRVDQSTSRIPSGFVGGQVAPIGGFEPALTDAFENKIKHYSVGVAFNLNPTNSIDLGWEQARVTPYDSAGVNPLGVFGNGQTKETYFNIGLGHTFNQNTLIKVMYQIVDYKDNGAGLYTVPGGSYKGGIGVTQLSVRF